MIRAQKNPYVARWFLDYTRRYLRRSFHRVLVAGEAPAMPDGPVLVCMNHSSWWDMLLAYWLSDGYLGWDGYGPMDERQLRRYPILTRIGVCGVDRESLQGVREFLEYGRTLLAGQRRSLWVTAQGAMVSTDVRPIRLYSGIGRLAQALGPCHVLTVALDYEFWEEKRPEVFVSLGALRQVDGSAGTSPKALVHQLEGALEAQMDELAVLRRQRDPSRFRAALGGTGSISPLYDNARRLGCWARGESYEQEHGAVASPPRWGPARK